ncbi:hypothetical protein ACF2JD_20700 [Aeromonas sp. A-5]
MRGHLAQSTAGRDPDRQRLSRFIETKPENYQGIEAAATQAGLLK